MMALSGFLASTIPLSEPIILLISPTFLFVSYQPSAVSFQQEKAKSD
jgi:hypothetical protein